MLQRDFDNRTQIFMVNADKNQRHQPESASYSYLFRLTSRYSIRQGKKIRADAK